MKLVLMSLLLCVMGIALMLIEVLVLFFLAIVGILIGDNSLVEPLNRVFRAALDQDIWDVI